MKDTATGINTVRIAWRVHAIVIQESKGRFGRPDDTKQSVAVSDDGFLSIYVACRQRWAES